MVKYIRSLVWSNDICVFGIFIFWLVVLLLQFSLFSQCLCIVVGKKMSVLKIMMNGKSLILKISLVSI